MATKQEITDGIARSIAHVERTFGSLSDEQLGTRVHEGEGGWTARDILAHLAGRARGYEIMGQLAAGGSPPSGLDVNRWNQERIDERDGKSRDELLAEFRAVHEGVIAQVRGMDDAVLARTVQFGPQPAPVGDLLLRAAGTHSDMHAEQVERALGLDA